MSESVDFVVVGCGPAGGTAAREASRAGVETVVLEKDPVVGAKRVCAAGLRPGFCETFDLPRSIVHCDPRTIALHDADGRRYEVNVGTSAHTTTREELDGTIADFARAEGASIRTNALFRGFERDGDRVVVEYADLRSGERRKVRARSLFLAQGATARLENSSEFAYGAWPQGLITCYQYRVYPDRPATNQTYRTLEMHYYRSQRGRSVIGWMFPKRDHLSIGLGIGAKVPGAELREELDAFLRTVADRLFPGTTYHVREEGNLLYGGAPRPRIGAANIMVGGTAAGLVDATTGEGIHEAASSGRFAAAAIAAARAGKAVAAAAYEHATKEAFYGKLRHRHKLMTFLERKPARFQILFEHFASAPKFVELLQHDRHDFTFGQWLYLYTNAALFGLRALAPNAH